MVSADAKTERNYNSGFMGLKKLSQSKGKW